MNRLIKWFRKHFYISEEEFARMKKEVEISEKSFELGYRMGQRTKRI